MSVPAIHIEQLSKIYCPPMKWLRRVLNRPVQDDVTALDGVDLEVRSGEIFGLVGRNGQGKTTLVKTVSALVEPSSGHIEVYGIDVRVAPHEARQRIGLVTSDERSFYWRLTGRQNLTFFARLYGLDGASGQKKIDAICGMFGMQDLVDRPFRTYSSGNRQKLAIVRALLPDPDLLLLDEPTRSLDPIAAQELRTFIREELNEKAGKTVFLTTHHLPDVEELCHRVAIIKRGRLLECAPLDELKRKYLGGEEVCLRIRDFAEGILDGDEFKSLQIDFLNLENGLRELRFRHDAKDDHLHRVLERVLQADGKIVTCETRHRGLKEIMEEIERKDAE